MTEVFITIITVFGGAFMTWYYKRKESEKSKLDSILSKIDVTGKKIDIMQKTVENLEYRVEKSRLIRLALKDIAEINENGIAYSPDDRCSKFLLMKYKNYIEIVGYILTYYENININSDFRTMARSVIDNIERIARTDGILDFYKHTHKIIEPIMKEVMQGIINIVNDDVNNHKIPRIGKLFCDYWKQVCIITNKEYLSFYKNQGMKTQKPIKTIERNSILKRAGENVMK